MNAEIIAVGSELLTPYRIDTNSLFLTAELNRLGVRVMRKTVVGDNREELREALEHALSHAELVVCSGGLGPTVDDLTRETVAELLGRKLQRNRRNPARHSGALSKIRARHAGNQCAAGDGAGRSGSAR